ncbi:MAG: tryptophan synthase subunit alpha [Acidimicrobiales bacterium]
MTGQDLEDHLRARRQAGAKLLVPYVTGGLGPGWTDVIRALADAGADAVEVGIPFSDPVMDGPVIQRASEAALASGATPARCLAGIESLGVKIPVVVMTYFNPVFVAGPANFALRLAEAGVAGAIVADLPFEEVDEWAPAADGAGVATVLMAAPTTPDGTLEAICGRSRGWVYGVSRMGVTGEQGGLAASAAAIGARIKAVTDVPVLLGVGVSNREQAVAAAAAADGVIVGSALVRRLLGGASAAEAAEFVGGIRSALDSVHQAT